MIYPPHLDLVGLLPTHKTKTYKTRNVDRIDRVVVHHTGAINANGLAGATRTARHCVDNRKFPGIPYHWMVDRGGQLLRTQPEEVISYHTKTPLAKPWPNINARGIGVALVGLFPVDHVSSSPHLKPTPAQLETLFDLLEYYRDLRGIKIFRLHNEYTKPACPGLEVTQLVKEWRAPLRS